MGVLARHGRSLLAGLTGLMAVALLAWTAMLLAHRTQSVRWGPAFPRIQQAAGIIDLLRDADPALRPAILRALDGLDLRAVVLPTLPPEPPGLRQAPRIAEKIREFAAPGLAEDVRAYTDAAVPQRDTGTEGWPIRITWRMSGGEALVLTYPGHDAASRPRLPVGLWIGAAGVMVAGMGLLLGRRNTRLLRGLTAAAESFEGVPTGTAASMEADPDLRRLASAVDEMQRRMAMLLGERSFLIGAISHDLKTFLTRVRLRAESLPDLIDRDRMAGDLDAMTDLIDTSLAFARGTTVTQHRLLVDLADLAAVEIAERVAVGQSVVAAGEDGADAVVLGDPVALRRVLANLIDNALKFGRGRVEVRVEAAGSMSHRVAVDDDGPGIGEAERTAVFSPFYRLEGSRNRRSGGSGLGLAIARQIVEAHGGTIAAAVSPLGGARLVVTLPRALTR